MPTGKPVSAELRQMISDKVDAGSSNEDIWRDLFPMGTDLLTRRTLQRYAKVCRSGTIGQKIIFLNGANLVKSGRPRIIDRLAERIFILPYNGNNNGRRQPRLGARQVMHLYSIHGTEGYKCKNFWNLFETSHEKRMNQYNA